MLSCVVTLHCFWFFVSDSTLLVTPTNCLKELVNVNLNKFFFFSNMVSSPWIQEYKMFSFLICSLRPENLMLIFPIFYKVVGL